MTFAALLHDRYAAFIWPAYGVTVVVFVWMVVDTVVRAHRWRRRAERLEQERTP